MVRVRYVGERDPLIVDPVRVRAALAAGRLTQAMLDDHTSRRLGGRKPGGGHYPVMGCVPGVTARILGPNEGLSRTVTWGPGLTSYVQEVSAADWAAIQALAEAAHFELDEDEASGVRCQPSEDS